MTCELIGGLSFTKVGISIWFIFGVWGLIDVSNRLQKHIRKKFAIQGLNGKEEIK